MHIADGIHALPEGFVFKGSYLSFSSQFFKRVKFPGCRIVFDVIDDPWLQNEKATIDPAFADLRLFDKLHHPVAVKTQAAEAGWRSCSTRASPAATTARARSS